MNTHINIKFSLQLLESEIVTICAWNSRRYPVLIFDEIKTEHRKFREMLAISGKMSNR